MITPLFTLMLLLFTFANAAVPATSGFIAEFYILVGVAFSMPWFALFISLAILLTPAYALLLFHRISYGQIGPYNILFADLSTLEFHLLFTLLSFTLIFGIFPNQIFALLHYSVLKIITIVVKLLVNNL
jgi:NADH-quinone oxidoreductase subunit M